MQRSIEIKKTTRCVLLFKPDLFLSNFVSDTASLTVLCHEQRKHPLTLSLR
jgi:hypothetical protein